MIIRCDFINKSHFIFWYLKWNVVSFTYILLSYRIMPAAAMRDTSSWILCMIYHLKVLILNNINHLYIRLFIYRKLTTFIGNIWTLMYTMTCELYVCLYIMHKGIHCPSKPVWVSMLRKSLCATLVRCSGHSVSAPCITTLYKWCSGANRPPGPIESWEHTTDVGALGSMTAVLAG